MSESKNPATKTGTETRREVDEAKPAENQTPEPTEPAVPAESAESADSAERAEPAQTAEPAEPAEPVDRVEASDALATEVPLARSPALMSRETAALLIIDVQEKLTPHIQNHPLVVWNIRRLIDGCRLLGVTTLCTEQYPQGLGSTVPLLSERITVDDEKVNFSCRECPELMEKLRRDNRHQILLTGIETHVCVQQSALDLLAMGFDVWVAVDAVGSRHQLDHETALQRMQSAGISLTTTESVLFEWCEVSGSHEFKRISTLVRETAPDSIDLPDAQYFPRPAARYIVESEHQEEQADDHSVLFQWHFLVRDTRSGEMVREYRGSATAASPDKKGVRPQEGVQAVEVTPDGTAVSVQHADGAISMSYLPVGDARTNHPRWKVRKYERHIGSEEYKNDFEIRFAVVDYRTDNTFREFVGYEHRDPTTGELTHVSGVRQIEISSDGRWMVITEVGRSPQLIKLPPEVRPG